MGQTMFDKLWQRHVIAEEADGETLVYVDRCLVHEGARHAFEKLERDGHAIWNPKQVIGFADHYAPTRNRDAGLDGIADPKIRNMLELMAINMARYDIPYFGLDDPRQGVLHVVSPEQGMTLPGMILVGADSHTSTHGAFGNLSFGLGASDTAHVLATQSLWLQRPGTMRITIDGEMSFGVTAKDVILSAIAKIGVGGGVGHVIEYAGSTIRRMSMEERMTVCNMSIEAGARAGMIAPDETTFAYLKGRPFAPDGSDWDAAMADWRTLGSDSDAVFDREVFFDVKDLAPMVTWGITPEQAVPINGCVPSPDETSGSEAQAEVRTALEYMDLAPGTPLVDIPIDRVFIGSCTNGRIEDLRAAAEVAKTGRAVVPVMVVPGSTIVKKQAEAEGLDKIFEAAGFEWCAAGCSMCTAINGDHLSPGERCASTSNRNFRGRQGTLGRTHLMSPAMAAATALRGQLADVRMLGEGA